MNRLLALLLLVAGIFGAGLGRDHLIRLESKGAGEKELLYLPNGKYLKVVSLGQAPLAADLLYLWAIQYYSDYRRADRYRYVEHVFGDVISELDPHYLDPYWLGAMILTVEARDLEAGLRLLDKGARNNPDAWILPYLAAWECERAGQYERAADYFLAASRVPGAPPMALRMRAGMSTKAGDLSEARRRWEEVLADPRSDDASRAIAARQVRDLKVRIDLADLGKAIQSFRLRMGRNPRVLGELVARGIVREIPLGPDGKPYAYDRVSGEVSSTAGRLLGGG